MGNNNDFLSILIKIIKCLITKINSKNEILKSNINYIP